MQHLAERERSIQDCIHPRITFDAQLFLEGTDLLGVVVIADTPCRHVVCGAVAVAGVVVLMWRMGIVSRGGRRGWKQGGSALSARETTNSTPTRTPRDRGTQEQRAPRGFHPGFALVSPSSFACPACPALLLQLIVVLRNLQCHIRDLKFPHPLRTGNNQLSVDYECLKVRPAARCE